MQPPRIGSQAAPWAFAVAIQCVSRRQAQLWRQSRAPSGRDRATTGERGWRSSHVPARWPPPTRRSPCWRRSPWISDPRRAGAEPEDLGCTFLRPQSEIGGRHVQRPEGTGQGGRAGRSPQESCRIIGTADGAGHAWRDHNLGLTEHRSWPMMQRRRSAFATNRPTRRIRLRSALRKTGCCGQQIDSTLALGFRIRWRARDRCFSRLRQCRRHLHAMAALARQPESDFGLGNDPTTWARTNRLPMCCIRGRRTGWSTDLKVGAACLNWASTDRCGGCRAIGIPVAGRRLVLSRC